MSKWKPQPFRPIPVLTEKGRLEGGFYARDVEASVVNAVRDQLDVSEEIEDADLIKANVVRVEAQPDQLLIELAEPNAANSRGRGKPRNVLGW